MKPFPAALIERYPQFGRVPERPWWRKSSNNYWFRGAEGWEHEIAVKRYYGSQNLYGVTTRSGDTLTTSDFASPTLLELLAQLDEAHPIPPPGFRAGQVWGDRHGNTSQILSVDCHGRLMAHCDATDRRSRANEGWSPLLSEFPQRTYPYLIADPCCPHLAPWSPS